MYTENLYIDPIHIKSLLSYSVRNDLKCKPFLTYPNMGRALKSSMYFCIDVTTRRKIFLASRKNVLSFSAHQNQVIQLSIQEISLLS